MRTFLLGLLVATSTLTACAHESTFRQRDPYGWPVPTWTAHQYSGFCYEQAQLVDFVNPTGNTGDIVRDDREGKYRVYRPANDRDGWYSYGRSSCNPDIAAIRAYSNSETIYTAPEAVTAPPPKYPTNATAAFVGQTTGDRAPQL